MREDINGDGYGDLMGWGTAGDTILQVFLGGPQFDVATPAATIEASLVSLPPRFAGDVNGDGFGDFLVFHGYAPTSGSVPLLFFGGVNVAGLANVMLTKDAGGSSANLGAGLPGDWNGDGFADLVVSWSYLVTNSSQLRVHFGGKSISINADVHVDSPFATIAAPGINDGGLVGDLNGDGFDDLGVFAVDYGGKASQLLFFLGGKVPDAVADLTIAQAIASSGSLARATDLDQDGFDDVVVANRSMSYGFVRGANPLSAQTFVTRANPDGALAVAGFDMNRNGKPEFIVNRSAGAAQIFEGTSLDPVVGGIPSGGCSLATASDYDGDGYTDLVAECDSTEVNICLGDGTLAPLCKFSTVVGRVVR
ncbi:MAG TPA: VCBS repeat-containing protein [Polyangia bacterium]|nr:VCBS repeat-containing protein [Polyangia bacterium]